MQPIELKINNIDYYCQNPLTIFQTCLEKRYYIPRFCYHSSLKISGNCRMCLIEEKSSIKPLASCAITITTGMQIFTNTEIVKKAREGVLEYLLINHPLDCPICDQGGECDLQDQTMVFGADRGRFYENKRSTSNKNFGFLVKTFLNRCIHCARCTRFLQDLNNNFNMSLLGRGYKTEISNYVNSFLIGELVGNIIDLCPVGALTSKPYAFKARPWELISITTFDIMDGFGSHVQLDFRGLELLRILPKANKNLNEEWISDNTRFYLDAIYIQRLSSTFYKFNAFFKKINWESSLNIIKFIFTLCIKNLQVHKQNLQQNFNFNFGDFIDLETSVATKLFYGKFLIQTCLYTYNDFRKNYFLNLNSLDSDNKQFKVCLILFTNTRFVSPILNLKIIRLVQENQILVNILGAIFNLNFFFEHKSTILNFKNFKTLNLKNTAVLSSFLNFNLGNNFEFNFIAPNISSLTLADVNVPPTKNYSNNPIQFYIGLKENLNFLPTSLFNLHLYHHMEEESFNTFLTRHQILLPTKFYYEKATSYINNNMYFFKTMHHYNFTIKNTKEEWKILYAILIKLGLVLDEPLINNKFTTLFETHLPKLPTHVKLLNLFLIKQDAEFSKNLFISKLKINKSLINNFFTKNVLTRLSPTLNLCSKKLSIINDYIFTTHFN